jgi:hypothetical protein
MTPKIRRLSAATLTCVLLAGPAMAQSPNEDAKITLTRQVMTELGGEATISAVMENVAKAMASGMIKDHPDQAAALNDLVASAMHDISAAVAPRMAEDAVHMYANNFDEQQLKDILAFYRTPTGKVLLAKLPEISRQSGVNATKYVPTIQVMMMDRACAKFGCPDAVKAQVQAAKKKLEKDGPT